MKILKGKEKDWEDCQKANSSDPYSNGVIRYAKRWAELMEEEIAKGSKLNEIAETTSHTADTEGITGFMYGCAVSILSQVWEYGEELRVWHNSEYGVAESDGVVNPAIINIKD